MEKINFSGGEPFIHDRGEYLGKLVKFCKEELQLPSVSIVSNGSLIREKWFKDYGELVGRILIATTVTVLHALPSDLGSRQGMLGPEQLGAVCGGNNFFF